MDDKKKIVLASKDVVVKKTEDVYINVNLKSSFNSIKKERFDNNFDLAEQFRRERNASRNFRVYGIIDSAKYDCDNLTLTIHSSGSANSSNIITSITSAPIGFGDKNVFGKMRGRYIIELDEYEDSNYIFIKLPPGLTSFQKQTVEVQLVFNDSDGHFIEYGTETIDIGINGEISTVNNDFPFFYNKHWIKTNFQVEKNKFGLVEVDILNPNLYLGNI